MKKKQVIGKIYLVGSSPREVAAKLEVSPQAVSRVCSGKGKSRRIADHISALIDEPVSQIWPGAYRDKNKHDSRRKKSVRRIAGRVSG